MISSMTAAEDPLYRPLFFYCLVVNRIPLYNGLQYSKSPMKKYGWEKNPELIKQRG